MMRDSGEVEINDLQHICKALRELTNGIQAYFEMEGLRGTMEYYQKNVEYKQCFREAVEHLDCVDPGGTTDHIHRNGVVVPRDIADLIEEIERETD